MAKANNSLPNIIYILEDHQAWYNHGSKFRDDAPKIHRPNFEKFASEGIEFTRCYTATPLCGPARRTMLTGLYPHNHGEIKNESNHPYDRQVYFDKLTEQGYTQYLCGKWHAGKGTSEQFGVYTISTPGYGNPYIMPEYYYYLEEKKLPHIKVRLEHVFHIPEVWDHYGFKIGGEYECKFMANHEHAAGTMLTPKETHETFFFADCACKILEKIANERSNGNTQPFHLRVDFWSPHQPYWAHPDYLKLYNTVEIPKHPSFDSDLSNKPNIYKFDLNYPMAESKVLQYPNPVPWSVYADTLKYNYAQQTMTDEAAGIILKKLEELGLDENTLVIWTTDHGDAIGCHGGHFDKESYMPEEMIRVPLAVKFLGVIPSEQISDKLVCNIDVAPTILDAAKTHFDEPIDGESIIPIAMNSETPWREDIMIQTYGNLVTHHGRCIVTNRYKYVYNWEDMDELYDLEEDPSELNNLINNSDFLKIIEDMKLRLKNWREKTGDKVERKWIRGKKLKPPKSK